MVGPRMFSFFLDVVYRREFSLDKSSADNILWLYAVSMTDSRNLKRHQELFESDTIPR